MDQSNRLTHRIDQINRATVRDVNAKAHAALICDQPVATLEACILRRRRFDNSDVISMHLLRGNERRVADSMLAPDFPMHAIQPGERLRFIVRHLDPRHAQGEPVRDLRQRAQRGKLFSRKLTFAHLLPVVFRVVVRVVVCWTGGRLPARFNSSGPGFGAGVGRASVLNLLRVNGSSSSFE